MDTIEVAKMLLAKGKPFQWAECHESLEDGPMSFLYKGLRLGQLRLILTPNHSVYLVLGREDNHRPTVYDSGLYGKSQGHWSDPTRRGIREILESRVYEI